MAVKPTRRSLASCATWLIVALTVAPLAGAKAKAQSPLSFRAAADSLLDAPAFRQAQWGVLVVHAASGDTLYSRNAGKLFIPASNQKLLTGAVALAQLGRDHRFTTRLLARPPRDGVVTGDLVVLGRGDPSFSDSLSGRALAPLEALADSLRARGVRRVTGRLVSGANVFPGDTLGLGWAWDDLDEEYAAPVDELLFNEGFATVVVHGGPRPGAPVRVEVRPSPAALAIGRVDVQTERNCCQLRSRVRARLDLRGARPSVQLSGSVRAGDSVQVQVALRHGNSAFLDVFASVLDARGIRVEGGVATDTLADTLGLTTLAERRSPTLPAVLVAFEKSSQNQLGEVLLKTLGLERRGSGTADSGLAVLRAQLAAWGVDSTMAIPRDGSGLSRHNLVTPEAIVRVLDAMRRHSQFDAFYQSLPVGGVDGTIRGRMGTGPVAGNVRAKTGSLDRVRALSGYVTTADGEILLFSILANHYAGPTREVDRVQDALLDRLATLTLRYR